MRLYGWGDNGSSNLGDGSDADRSTAVPVARGRRFAAAAGGLSHGVGTDPDGGAWSWGSDRDGALGNGPEDDFGRAQPVQVVGLPAGEVLVDLAVGRLHTLVLGSSGQVFAWGDDSQLQLGRTGADAASAEPVALPALAEGERVVDLAAGIFHSAVVTSDGRVLAWGGNGASQLGTGSVSGPRAAAEPVGGLLTGKRIVAVSAQGDFTVALDDRGDAFGWGRNAQGQLGDGTTGTALSPVAVDLPEPVVELAASVLHTAARTADGRVYVWGDNREQQLGDDTVGGRTTPALLEGVTGATALSAGYRHTLALTADGVTAWGDNSQGQLGVGDKVVRPRPVQVQGLPAGRPVLQVARGAYSSFALLEPRAEPPLVTAQPTALTVDAGATARFEAAASGVPAPRVQWQRSADGAAFTDVDGATSPVYALTAGADDDGAFFRAVFTNATGTATSQPARLTVRSVPVVLSAAATTFTVGGPAEAFRFEATGGPAPVLSLTGALPQGVTFTAGAPSGQPDRAGPSTAALEGDAAPGTGGSYPLAIVAQNARGRTEQSFVLTVDEPPVLDAPPLALSTTGRELRVALRADGHPVPVIGTDSALPAGVVLTAAGDGTAMLVGTPAEGTAGTYEVLLRATSHAGSDERRLVLQVLPGLVPLPPVQDPPPASGSPSPRPSPSPSASPDPIPSASASPSPSASASSPAASPATSRPRLRLTVLDRRIEPTQVARVRVDGGDGSAVELRCYSRPSQTYRTVRRAVGSSATFGLRPGQNTRCYARYDGTEASASTSDVVLVGTTLSLSAVRTGVRDYRFEGRNLPRRSGQLVTLHQVDDRGREVRLGSARTDATGTWRVPRSFPRAGTAVFVARTGDSPNNAAGVSKRYRLEVR